MSRADVRCGGVDLVRGNVPEGYASGSLARGGWVSVISLRTIRDWRDGWRCRRVPPAFAIYPSGLNGPGALPFTQPPALAKNGVELLLHFEQQTLVAPCVERNPN